MLRAYHAAGKPLNLVLITADDMNWDSAGCNGCTIPGITSHIDRLAAEGIVFREAHKWQSKWNFQGSRGVCEAKPVPMEEEREKGWA